MKFLFVLDSPLFERTRGLRIRRLAQSLFGLGEIPFLRCNSERRTAVSQSPEKFSSKDPVFFGQNRNACFLRISKRSSKQISIGKEKPFRPFENIRRSSILFAENGAVPQPLPFFETSHQFAPPHEDSGVMILMLIALGHAGACGVLCFGLPHSACNQAYASEHKSISSKPVLNSSSKPPTAKNNSLRIMKQAPVTARNSEKSEGGDFFHPRDNAMEHPWQK